VEKLDEKLAGVKGQLSKRAKRSAWSGDLWILALPLIFQPALWSNWSILCEAKASLPALCTMSVQHVRTKHGRKAAVEKRLAQRFLILVYLWTGCFLASNHTWG
jgi:hypothetical protein